MRIIFTLSLIIYLHYVSFAQDLHKLDSYWQEYKNAKHDTTRIKILNEKIGYFYESINTDSAIIFYKQAIELSEKNIKQNSILSKSFQNKRATAFRYIGIVYKNQGRYEDAIEHYLKALSIFEKLRDKKGISNCLNNIGTVNFEQGNYDKAIDYFLKALKNFEEFGYKIGMAECYNNIALVYSFEGSYDMALDYNMKSLKIFEELQSKSGMSGSYNNMGGILHKQGSLLNNVIERDEKFDQAINYYLKALKIFEDVGSKKGMSQCYNNIGSIHFDNGNFDKVKYYYLKSLKIKKELEDKKGISLIFGNISKLNLLQADSCDSHKRFSDRNKYLDSAILYGKKAYIIAQEINSNASINIAVEKLYKSLTKIGNYKEALKFAEIYISTKEIMFSDEKTKALTEMEIKYQSEKKQLEIEKLGKQKELDNQTIIAQTAENKKQRILIISFVIGFILILLFSMLLYRLFVQKKKANILLAKQNAEISQQKEEITTQRDEIEAQRDEIEAQRDLVTIQKEEIEEIHREVKASINYAKRIQEAVLPVSIESRSVLGEHFVLFKPKDIVSGDFYWTTKINKWVIVTVADCTGHGVPGAFMSMLGISYLNEIVQKKEINKANQILNILRLEIINALQQKGVQGEQKDGMDISLLVINTDTNECQWAGANNPLYVVRKFIKSESKKLEENNFQLSNFQLDELKGDKMPIAIYPEMKDFTNHEFKLEKGDNVYLFTDGYADQFGGPKGRKFMYKQFKEILITNCNLPMIEQKIILETYFEKWKGNFEQIDDITVLGMCL